MRKINSFLKKNNILPSNLLTFPNHLLVETPWGGSAFRFMVDSVNGDDSFDGFSWANAKKSIQGAIDSLPKDLQGHGATLFIKPGTYNGILLDNFKNGSISFEWFGLPFTNADPTTLQSWGLNGESVTTTNDPIIIKEGLNNASQCILVTGENFYAWFNARDDRFNQWSAGHQYRSRWVISPSDDHTATGVYVGGDCSFECLSFRAYLNKLNDPALSIDNGRARLDSPEFFGGTGSTSVSTSQWESAIMVTGPNADVELGKLTSINIGEAAGYTALAKYKIYSEDIKQTLNFNVSAKNFSMLDSSGIEYVDNVQSYGKTIIRLDASTSNVGIAYSESEVTLNDLSTNPRTIKNLTTGETKVYLSTKLIDDGSNLSFDGGAIFDLPTSDPLVVGALWNDTGTVKVSAG